MKYNNGKSLFLALALSVTLFCSGAAVPRVTELSGQIQKITSFEIVTETPASRLLQFAALEMQEFIHKRTGVKPRILAKPTGKNIALILGDNSFSRKAGIDVKKLPPEGYYIIRKGNNIFLAGVDSASQHPWTGSWQQAYQRGTLSAVYDFLERFASIRFYFSAPEGTVIPPRGAISLPEKINILERPDMSYRDYYHGAARVYPGYYSRKKYPHGETLNRIRLRFSENMINYGHGQCFLNLVERFGESHPEYFALMPDGRRCKEKNIPHTGHLCYSSNVVEELYQDAKAFLTGKPSTTRGIPRWRRHNRRSNVFNIMPQDWLYWCGCEKCSKIAEVGRGKIYKDPKHNRAVSDFMWKITADMGHRLKKEGIKGGIAQMAYSPYNKVPDFPIPDNVYIMVSTYGIGADKNDTELLKAWSRANNKKPVVWTYFISRTIHGIPPVAPRAVGAYLEANKNIIDGGFFQAGSDYLLWQYLNYYILAKKAWNNYLSTEALLDEHHRVMFGKGAPFMKKFYDKLEEYWCKKINGNVVETGLGPVAKLPSDFQLWNDIYSPRLMKEFNTLFAKARKAASSDKGAVSRIDYIRKNFFAPLEKAAQKYADNQASLDSWELLCPGSVYLRPYSGEVNEVSTRVTVNRTAEELIFTFDCEEPRMKDIIARQTNRDAAGIYNDSEVEIFINPSGDRKHYYQFAVNSNGALVDYKCENAVVDISWNSSATAKVVKKSSSWSVTVTIPLKDLGTLAAGGVPVNFARHRALKGKRPKEVFYQWSPMSGKRGGFHAIHNWGKLSFGKAKKHFFNEEFASGKLQGVWKSGGIKGGQVAKIDKKVFISGGKSLYLENVKGHKLSVGYRLEGLKPSTRYRLSYFIKTGALTGTSGGAGAFVSFNKNMGRALPNPAILGTKPWHRVAFEFKTPESTGEGREPILGLWIWQAPGEAWFDNIRIEEIR